MSLVKLLEYGSKKTAFAPMCYSAALDVLMNQDKKHFVMVMDEFNCFFDVGYYFHADYDESVKKSIPYNQISLFKPFLDVMGLTAVAESGEEEAAAPTEGRKPEGLTEARGGAPDDLKRIKGVELPLQLGHVIRHHGC